MKKGKIIVLEGACDGIGKTTQFNKIKEHFNAENIDYVEHHFPSYDNDAGILVKNYLDGKYGDTSELNPYYINSLYAVDRATTWYSVLKKEYDAGKIVLLDRYTTSSLIYQSALIDSKEQKDIFLNFVNDYEYNKLGIPKPDLVIFLTASYENAKDMRSKRNVEIKEDIHEKNDNYLKAVYKNALELSKIYKWDVINITNGTGIKSINEIHDEIYSIIKKIM